MSRPPKLPTTRSTVIMTEAAQTPDYMPGMLAKQSNLLVGAAPWFMLALCLAQRERQTYFDFRVREARDRIAQRMQAYDSRPPCNRKAALTAKTQGHSLSDSIAV